MKWKSQLWLITALILALIPLAWQPATAQERKPHNRVLAHALDVELGRTAPAKYEQRVSSGVLYAVLGATGEINKRIEAAAIAGIARIPLPSPLLSLSHQGTQGCSNVYKSGRLGNISNTRVNQDCSLRRQAEEVIAINPTNPQNLIAGQNDSRIGFNHCGYDWSFDGGITWGDLVPPFYQFILADGHTVDACSDPTATFDAQSNAYIAGILFDINAAASALVVAKSNAGIGGAFYHAPNPALSFQEYLTDPLGVVANDNDPNIFNDKDLMVADANPSSPKANNIYVTWSRFNSATGAGVGGNSPIYFSQSTDGGATWSPGIEISGANATNCTAFSGEANPNACDQDQGSHPIVGNDGTIYVAFGNGNTPTLGLNQHMIVSCPPTKNCSQAANWTAPVKISDDFGTQPAGPDATTGCDASVQCLPPNGYRLDDFITGSVSIDTSGKLYFVWADFRNGGANCNPNGSAATATPPCNNDVFYAYSTNGGATWSGPINVTPAVQFGHTAQWMPWSAVTPNGQVLWVAYYDRSYGNCEFTGCNDITLAKVQSPATAVPTMTYQRLTTSSMPNLVPANNPVQAGFLGDYMWVAVDSNGRPHVVWADTRGLGGTVEEDVYFFRGTIP